MRSFSLLVLLAGSWSIAQSLTVGVAGGGRLTDDVINSTTPESKRYVVGPMIELGLPWNFGVEFDALYHPYRYQVSYGGGAAGITDTERANSWEFPILLRYTIPVRRIRPFAEAGIAPRTISGSINSSGYFLNSTGTISNFNGSGPTNWPASVGVVVGGGVRFNVGRLSFSPEVRYTHWTTTPVIDGGNNGPTAYSNQEQFDILVGVGWMIHRSNR